MASPFPGMDPYIERPDLWPEFHNRFAVYLCDALQPQLPANYVARTELRIYTEREGGLSWMGSRVPDLELVRTGGRQRSDSGGAGEGSPLPEGHWFAAPLVERRELYIVIQNLDGGRLVTALELLSPSNKRPGEGREKYLSKQAEFLSADVNLIEIDLLRGGRHTVAIDAEQVDVLRPFDYLICTYRTAPRMGFWVQPWKLPAAVPDLTVPLEPGLSELRLTFKPLIDAAYVNSAFRKLINYEVEPIPPLAPEDAAWADTLQREAGLRGSPGA